MALVPSGWLREYLCVMIEAHNEMPLPFHFLAGAVVVGQLLGLECWTTLARRVRVYPNLNALLLSPAGKCRRGEGTKITTRLAEMAGVNVLNKATPEGLLDELREKNGNVLLYAEELSMLLTDQDFQRPLIPVLTKLLLHGEGRAVLRTRGLGRQEVGRVNLSALFTSAPDWFMTTIPKEAFGGGLMSRFLVCCLEDREVMHIDIAAEDGEEDGVLDGLVRKLFDLRGVLRGQFKGTKEAQEWIGKWYEKNESESVEDDRLMPHRNRKPANLLRLATVLAASEGGGELTRERLEQALAIIEYMEPTLARLYGISEELMSVMHKGERRILQKLGSVPGGRMRHSELLRACSSYFKGGAREMRVCLEGLREKGIVVSEQNGYKPWPPEAWAIREVV